MKVLIDLENRFNELANANEILKLTNSKNFSELIEIIFEEEFKEFENAILKGEKEILNFIKTH